MNAGEAPASGVVASGGDVKAAAGPAAGFRVVIVRQGPGADRSSAAGAPVVDNLSDALSRVASGGTIRVKAGTYAMPSLDISRPVTIVGDGAAPTLVPLDPSVHGHGFNIAADGNTTVRNLRFEGFRDALVVSEFGVTDPYDLVVIEDVHIELEDGTTSGVTAFPATSPDDGRTIVVRNSTIVGGWRGLHVHSDVPNVVAVGNRFIDQNSAGASAIGFSDGASGLLEENTLRGCSHQCIGVGGGDRTKGVVEIRGNVLLATIDNPIGWPIIATGLSVSVVDNRIEGTGGAMDPADPATWPIQFDAILFESVEAGELFGNTIRNAQSALSFGFDVGTVTGIDNMVDGTFEALQVGNVESLTLRSTDFVNYEKAGRINDPDADVRCNWWGTAAGPIDLSAPDPSQYTPWATEPVAGTSTTTCAGGH